MTYPPFDSDGGSLRRGFSASTLAALLEEVDAPSNWSAAAAEHVATTLTAQSDTMAPTVTDVSDRRRFEIAVDGTVLGFAEYRRRPGVISFIHTEIDPAHEGKSWERCSSKPRWIPHERRGWRCCPTAHSSRAFIGRHREYLDLVPVERRAKFALEDD